MRRVGYAGLAAYLGLPVGSLRSMVSRRQIPHARIGKRTVIFDLDSIDQWLAERTIEPVERPIVPLLRIVNGDS